MHQASSSLSAFLSDTLSITREYCMPFHVIPAQAQTVHPNDLGSAVGTPLENKQSY